MEVSAKYLERKISKINRWLDRNPKTHFSYKQFEQNRNYYVHKLCEMDDKKIETIKI